MAVTVNILNHKVNFGETTTDLYLPVSVGVASSIFGLSTKLPIYMYLNDESSISIEKLKINIGLNAYKYYISDAYTAYTAIVDNDERQYTLTVTDTSSFIDGDILTLVADNTTDDDLLPYNGTTLKVIEVIDSTHVKIIAYNDNNDYTEISSFGGHVYKLYDVSDNRNMFYEISDVEIVDYNLFIDTFWEAIEGSTNTFTGIMLFSSELLNVDDITGGGDFGYNYQSEGVLALETSRNIAFRKNEYGDIIPSIYIDDIEGSGNSLDFDKNYKFSYEFNVNSLDSTATVPRSEASISGNYIDNIISFAETFSIKALSDIYEYIASLNIKYNIYEKEDTLQVNSNGKNNLIIFSERNNENSVIIKNEDGTYFDSSKFIKKTDIETSMDIVFTSLKTKELSLYNDSNEKAGYITISGDDDEILELSYGNNKLTIENNIISSTNDTLKFTDDVLFNDFSVVDEDDITFVKFSDYTASFTVIDNKPNNQSSAFQVNSANYYLIGTAVVNNIDVVSLGSFDILESVENLTDDTWLSNSGSVDNTGILISQKNQFLKINSMNNAELAGNGTLYIDFDKVIIEGIIENKQTVDVTTNAVLKDSNNIMSSDAKIVYSDTYSITANGVEGEFKANKYITFHDVTEEDDDDDDSDIITIEYHVGSYETYKWNTTRFKKDRIEIEYKSWAGTYDADIVIGGKNNIISGQGAGGSDYYTVLHNTLSIQNISGQICEVGYNGINLKKNTNGFMDDSGGLDYNYSFRAIEMKAKDPNDSDTEKTFWVLGYIE